MNLLRTYKLEIGIFILALLVRFGLFGAAFATNEWRLIDTISGADGYYTISQNIILGNGYSSSLASPFIPNSIRPPVFPYFLAGLYKMFDSYWTPLTVQLLLSCLIPLLGMFLAQKIIESKKVSITVGVLLALEPFSAFFATFFYSETVFTFLLLSSLFLLFKYGEKQSLYFIVGSAFLLGLATLTKPTAEFLPIIYISYVVWIMRKNLKMVFVHVVLFSVVFILVLTPWLYRNYQVFGVIGISPQLGEQLYNVLVPSVLAVNNHTSFQQEFDIILANGGTDPNSASITQGNKYTVLAIPILFAHPIALVITLGNTALNFFIHDGLFDTLRHIGLGTTIRFGQPALFLLLSDPVKLFTSIYTVLFTPSILILFGRILWIFITIAFVVGVIESIRYERTAQNIKPNIIATVSIVVYFMLTTLVIGLAVNARYRMPVNALIFVFAAYMIHVLTQRRNKNLCIKSNDL